ncbi:N-formyl peptide receptor 2-like [Macrotis lagotis]|uniref:N-formyl peptide receptor 2-like n=1 Tax=Macrotis lagotis TaxID=92651 RepID=UPI003D691E28
MVSLLKGTHHDGFHLQGPHTSHLVTLEERNLQCHPIASVFLLTLISLDRCVSVLWPLWSRKHRTPHRAALGAIGAWIFALAFTIPTVNFRTTEVGVNDIDYCYYEFTPWIGTRDNTVYNDALYKGHQWPLALSRFILSFVIPLLIISVCCGLITVKLLSRINKIKSRRPFKILTAVVAAFFLCWFPCHLERLIEASICSHPQLTKVLPYLSILSTPLIFVNSCLNPLLYVFVGQDFRERLLRSLPAALEKALSEESAPPGTTGNSSTLASPDKNAKSQDL